jgi:D-alanine-D-alanine ligase
LSRLQPLTVITGDHRAADPTKKGAAYGEEDLKAHRLMVEAFESLGRFELTVLTDHGCLFERLAAERPELVVNFCDTGIGNLPDRELNLPAWLELHGIAYTGATPQAMVLCYDKQAVSLVAAALGIEVARERYLAPDPDLDALPELYPALIKPNRADGSVGITKHAVVRDPAEARRHLGWLAQALPGRGLLWQEYLPGPEFGVGVIGNPATGLTMLPPIEVDFSRLPPGLPPILSFESKADPASPYWTELRFRRAEMAQDVRVRLETWASRLFARLGLQDYGRFDFRCAADGRPKLMEVNPNPAWGYDAKLAIMAGFAGIDYLKMLEMVVDAALARIAAAGPARACAGAATPAGAES